MAILSVENLSKTYGHIKALKGVSFSVPKGSVFGILGPNGSGKTTLLGIIMNVLRPSGGGFRLFDEKPTDEHRKMIGTLLETPNFYHYLTAVQNLKITAAIKGHDTAGIDGILKIVNLHHRKDSAFSTYSLGMKQRLAIGAALLGDPGVLVFDEPTNGLDPVGIAEIRNLIKELSANGKTIIMASHLLDEVQKVCTHVAILQQGNLVASGSVGELFAQDDVVQLRARDMSKLRQLAGRITGGKTVTEKDSAVEISFNAGTVDLAAMNQFCFDNGIVLSTLQLRQNSIETKFLELTTEKK